MGAIETSSIVRPNRVAPSGATSGTGEGENRSYGLNNRPEQEDSPDVVTNMIQIFYPVFFF